MSLLRRRTLGIALAASLLLGGCSRPPESTPPPTPARGPQPSASRPKIVVLGDSLTAGLGLVAETQAYPALLQEKLKAGGYDWEVANAGVSGDTSAAGLQRVDWALDQGNVRILVLELGANDGLRGLPVSEMKKNLAAIIEAGQRAGLQVILAGMEAPPNNGPDYTARFRRVYPELAKAYDIPLIPFLLDGVAGDPALNQADGIHPNPEGARRVADTVWSALEPVLKSASGVR